MSDYGKPPQDVQRYRARAKVILASKRQGLTLEETMIGLGNAGGSPATSERIYVEGSARWDPVDDEVAIERAMQGDHKVIQNLTWFERDECLRRVLRSVQSLPDTELSHERSLALERMGYFGVRWTDMKNRTVDGSRAVIGRKGKRA